MARQDLEFIAEVLAQAVEGDANQARLRHGLALRQQMYAALNAGQPFVHYRMKWVSDAIDRVVDLGQAICREFDITHPDDMASAADLVDILRGALNLVMQQAGLSEEKK